MDTSFWDAFGHKRSALGEPQRCPSRYPTARAGRDLDEKHRETTDYATHNLLMSVQPQTPDEPTTTELLDAVQELTDRVDELESTVERQQGTIQSQQETIDELEADNDRLESMAQAAIKKAGANLDRVSELQSRELEKGAHLLEDNVDEAEVDVEGDRLEKIQKDDGEPYLRLPESEDPLGRGGSTTLAHGDLLPIQQLAQMDDDMLDRTAQTKGDCLAAKLWRARTDDNVVDNPWMKGCKGVREYVDASDLKQWIRRELGRGVTDEYAKKLVSRTISAMKDLSKDRIVVDKTATTRPGVTNKERRVKLMTDVEIPGETGGAETDDVHE